MTSKLDLILFGATGFTGKLCIKHLVDNYCNDKYNMKFGLAGRNMDKLKCILNSITEIDEKEKESYFELIECDSFNEKQIKSMISKTNTIITTVGPYSVYGEELIKLCSINGCDYVDLTGEFPWVKRMINKYNDEAKRSHARIINFGGCVAALTDCAIYSGIEQLKKNQNTDDITITSIKPGVIISGGGTSS
eukprot:508502_1